MDAGGRPRIDPTVSFDLSLVPVRREDSFWVSRYQAHLKDSQVETPGRAAAGGLDHGILAGAGNQWAGELRFGLWTTGALKIANQGHRL